MINLFPRCKKCGEAIIEADHDCAPQLVRAVCPRCFMELPINGKCECNDN